MTINSAIRKAGPFLGNGVTTAFPFTFKVFKKEDVLVTRTDANGVDFTLVLDSDYSVTLNGNQDNNPGGTITFPISGLPLQVGEKLTMTGSLAYTQPTDLPNPGPFFAQVVEDAFDRAEIQIQQVKEITDRSVKVGVSDDPLPALPGPQARSNTAIGFDATGTLTLLPIPSSIGAGDRIPFTLVNGVDFTPGATQVTLPRAPGTNGNLEVHWDGVPQEFGDWSVAGVTLTFAVPIPAYVTEIWGYIGTTLSTQTPPGDSVGDGQLQWSDILSRECNSIAELRALSSARYQRAHTLSYYGDGFPGSSGKYWMDPSDAVSPDNGGTVIVANDGARWKLIYDGSVDYLQFGARTGGIETAAQIQAAHDSLVRSIVCTTAHTIGTTITVPTSNQDIIFHRDGQLRANVNGLTFYKSTVSAYYVRFLSPKFHGNGHTTGVCMDMLNMRLYSGLLYPKFEAVDTGFIGRDGCFGLHIVNPTAEACAFPILFINNNSDSVIECPNFDNGAGVGGSGAGTGVTIQGTGTNLGCVIRGGYIQGYQYAVFDNGIGTTVRDMYIEGCTGADIKSTGARGGRYENLNHWGNVGPFAYQLDNTVGCTVWNPMMGSGARGALFDVDNSNLDFSRYIATTDSGVNTPLGTVPNVVHGPRSRFSFTPTIVGSTTPGVGVYTVQDGRVSLHAGQVEIEISIGLTSHTGTGTMIIQGIPVGLAPAAFSPRRIGQAVLTQIAFVGPVLYAYLNGTATDITVVQVSTAGTESPIPVPGGGGTIHIRLSYNANA